MIKNKPYMPVKSSSEEWETPQALFDKWDKIYHFTLDAAASKENAKCKKYFTKEDNALTQDWGDNVVWLNPPYNVDALFDFTKKVLSAAIRGATIVMLVPSKTDQEWFHLLWNQIHLNVKFDWVRGRVKFVGAKNSATIPNVVIIVN